MVRVVATSIENSSYNSECSGVVQNHISHMFGHELAHGEFQRKLLNGNTYGKSIVPEAPSSTTFWSERSSVE